jgi:hypothetical protein
VFMTSRDSPSPLYSYMPMSRRETMYAFDCTIKFIRDKQSAGTCFGRNYRRPGTLPPALQLGACRQMMITYCATALQGTAIRISLATSYVLLMLD